MEIIPSVHLVPNVIANAYLIMEPNGLALIDAGLPGSDRKILRYFTERGHAPRDLRTIIITHSDTDHVGGLAALKRATGAAVYASAIEAAAIAAGKPSRRTRPRQAAIRFLVNLSQKFFKSKPVEVDHVLAEGEVLPILGGLQVMETPGHTPGHISLFSPSSSVLFVGDSMVVRNGQIVPSLPSLTWNEQAS